MGCLAPLLNPSPSLPHRYYANEAALQEMIQCLRPIEASAANGVNFEEFKESKQPLPIIRKIASSKILHEIAEWQVCAEC